MEGGHSRTVAMSGRQGHRQRPVVWNSSARGRGGVVYMADRKHSVYSSETIHFCSARIVQLGVGMFFPFITPIFMLLGGP